MTGRRPDQIAAPADPLKARSSDCPSVQKIHFRNLQAYRFVYLSHGEIETRRSRKMNRLLGLAVGAAILGMVSLGCTEADESGTANQPSPSGETRLMNSGPGISISEAIAS